MWGGGYDGGEGVGGWGADGGGRQGHSSSSSSSSASTTAIKQPKVPPGGFGCVCRRGGGIAKEGGKDTAAVPLQGVGGTVRHQHQAAQGAPRWVGARSVTLLPDCTLTGGRGGGRGGAGRQGERERSRPTGQERARADGEKTSAAEPPALSSSTRSSSHPRCQQEGPDQGMWAGAGYAGGEV